MIYRAIRRLGAALVHPAQVQSRSTQINQRPSSKIKPRLGRRLWWLPVAALAFSGQAQAETWPTKPVRIVTPFAAGGAVDKVARLLADSLSQRTGKQFVVDSKPGAAGAIAAVEVARAPTDGYTLLFGTNTTHAVRPALSEQLQYKVEDFTPIALVVESNVFLLASPTLGAKSVPELLALARSKPGSINYGSGGLGSHGHVTYELLAAQAGVELTHVPYTGIGAAYPDLLTGRIQLLTDAVTGALQYVQSGKAVALAVTGPTRSAIVPEVPTVGETLPGYSVVTWFGLYGPRGLAPALAARINEEVNRTLHAPDFAARLTEMGLDVGRGSPAEFAEYADSDRKRWTQVARQRNIKLD